MNKLRSVLLCGAVVLVTVTWMAVGLQLVFDAIANHHGHVEYWTGLAMVFPTSIAVAGLTGILVHRFIPGERDRGREYLEQTRSGRRKNLLKRRERLIQRLKFLRRHPSVALGFILIAMAVSIAMLFAPSTRDNAYDASVLHVLGAFLAIGYLVMLGFFLYLVITKRWKPTLDGSIHMVEERQVRVADGKAEPPL